MVAWLLLVPAVALAQERRELTIRTGEAPVSVFADRIENFEADRLLIAEGRVELVQGEVRLEANRLEVNTETGEAVAAGRIVFFDGRDRLVGERLEYNLRTGTGVVYKGEGFAEPHFFFSGARMERFGEKAYRLTDGAFTTCEDESPAWSVHWGQATAYVDDYIWGTNASFWVWKIPVIPFIPFFGASLRKDRHSGCLTPTFGTSSTKGFTFRQPVFWAIDDSQDLTLIPTVYEKRGVGLGATYRYVRKETSRGDISGFGLYDTNVNEPRGVAGLRHDEQLTPRLTLKADLAYVSDNQYFNEFGDSLNQRSTQRLESNLSVTQRWEKWNLVGRLFAYQDLTTTQPVELQRLPEITLNAFQQPTPWLRGLLYQLESSYVNFVRDVGSDGQRLDLHPQLSYPFSPGGFFTVTPRVGLRETIYDTKAIGLEVDRGFVVQKTSKTFVDRTLFETGVDLEARAYRVFDVGALGIQKVQHVIEPRISYNYLSDADSQDLPQFDGIDTIRSSNGVTYSLTNRLKARAVGTDDKPGRVWELLRLTLSQAYDLDSPPRVTPTSPIGQPPVTPITPTSDGALEPKRLSDLTADLILEPAFGLRFRGTAAIDPYEQRFRSLITDVAYETAVWRVAFGTRHGDGAELQFVQGSVEARFATRWRLRFTTNYDVQGSRVIENRLEAEYREQCWAVTGAYINRTDENEFHVTVNLLALGQYGFGQSLSQ